MNCPTCGSEMRPLFTSLYCPMNGGRGCTSPTLELGGRRWRYARVEGGEVVPMWATHGWYLSSESNAPLMDSSVPAEELLARMQREWHRRKEPGWPIADSSTVAVGKRSPRMLAVFGVVP